MPIPGYNSVLHAPPPSSPSLPGFFRPVIALPLSMFVITPTQVKNVALGFVEFHNICPSFSANSQKYLDCNLTQLLLGCKHKSETQGLTFLIVYIILILLPSLWCIYKAFYLLHEPQTLLQFKVILISILYDGAIQLTFQKFLIFSLICPILCCL